MLRRMEMRLQMYSNICHFRCRMPCRVRTTKADLTDIEAVHWGGAEIKSSTRISEASDTLAWALWFSEERTAWLSLTLWTHIVAKKMRGRGEKKAHISCYNDTETKPIAWPIWRLHLNYCLNQFLTMTDGDTLFHCFCRSQNIFSVLCPCFHLVLVKSDFSKALFVNNDINNFELNHKPCGHVEVELLSVESTIQSFSCLDYICDWISKAKKGPIKLSCVDGALSNKQNHFPFFNQ